MSALATQGQASCAVYAAIHAVQSALSEQGIGKDRTAQGYKFRGIDDIYNALAGLLAVHKLCIIPRVISRECVERSSKSGGALFYVTVTSEFDLVGPDGSIHTARTIGEAMDSSDKATNKAMSAAYKYMCFQLFCIPTEAMDSENHSYEVVSERRIAETKAKVQQAKAAKNEVPPHIAEWADLDPEPPDGGIEARAQAKEAEAQAVIAEEEKKGKPVKAKAAPAVSLDMLQAFGDMKTKLREDTGDDAAYYRILKSAGYAKSSEIPSRQIGTVVYNLLKNEVVRLRSDKVNRAEIQEIADKLGPAKFFDILGRDLSMDAMEYEAATGEQLMRVLEVLRSAK